MKKLLIVIISLITLVAATACGSNKSADNNKSGSDKVVKVGISPAELPTWNLVKKLAAKQNINIQIVKFNDYVQPNLALNNGDVDLNAFQHITYLNDFKKQHNLDITPIGTTAIWPMGIYSKKVKDIKDIKNGDQIVIPNDPTNGARSLYFLQTAGLITLKDSFTSTSGVEAIKDNPKNLKITPVDAAQTPRGLDDAAAAIINNDMAINAGLDPVKDPILREGKKNKAYINVIAAKTKDKDNKTYLKIVKIFQSKEVQDFVKKQYKGAAVPVVEPISDIINIK
ncbi:MAG: MetQ/NlpA family ABC transporter substrate-binding protein [Tuberibacillus sp.]